MVGKPVEGKPEEDKPVEGEPEEDKPVEGEPEEDKPVEGKPVEGKPEEGKHVEGKPVEEDNQQQDNLELDQEGGSHAVAHMKVQKDGQLVEELADLHVTSVEWEALPLLVETQIYHLFYPFQSCVVSALLNSTIHW